MTKEFPRELVQSRCSAYVKLAREQREKTIVPEVVAVDEPPTHGIPINTSPPKSSPPESSTPKSSPREPSPPNYAGLIRTVGHMIDGSDSSAADDVKKDFWLEGELQYTMDRVTEFQTLVSFLVRTGKTKV